MSISRLCIVLSVLCPLPPKYTKMAKYPNTVQYGLYRHPERMEGFYWLLTLIFDLVYFGLFWFILVYFGSFWSTVSWPILVYFPYWYCMEWSIWATLLLLPPSKHTYELYIALCNEPYMKDLQEGGTPRTRCFEVSVCHMYMHSIGEHMLDVTVY